MNDRTIKFLVVAATLFFLAKCAYSQEFYVGGFGTYTTIDSTVTRGPFSFVDQGGDGLGVGLRAGAGWRPFRPLYTGIELEGIRHIATSSRNSVVSYRATPLWTGSVFARLGMDIHDRGMVYLRGGASATRIQGTDTITTAAGGGGLEIVLTERWSAHLS